MKKYNIGKDQVLNLEWNNYTVEEMKMFNDLL